MKTQSVDPLLPCMSERIMLFMPDRYRESPDPMSPARVFYTMVQDVAGDLIALGLPMTSTHYVPVPVGERVVLSYVRGDAAYRVEAEAVKVDLDHGPALLWVAYRGPVRRVQRRRFVRLPVSLPVRFKPLGSPDDTWLRGLALDLSGGGVLLQAEAPLRAGDQLLLQLPLEDAALEVTGQVVRTGEKNTAFEPPLTEYGIAFVDCEWTVRERIIKFIFAEQRRRLQKERGLGG